MPSPRLQIVKLLLLLFLLAMPQNMSFSAFFAVVCLVFSSPPYDFACLFVIFVLYLQCCLFSLLSLLLQLARSFLCTVFFCFLLHFAMRKANNFALLISNISKSLYFLHYAMFVFFLLIYFI